MKRILPLFLTFLLLFSACSSPEKSLDLDSLSEQLLSAGIFTDELSPMDLDIAETLYEIKSEDYSEFLLYVSTGATAEEIALIHASGSQSAVAIKAAVDTRISRQISAFERYVPEEVSKLNSACVHVFGSYVIVCVSSDSAKAEAIISSAEA